MFHYNRIISGNINHSHLGFIAPAGIIKCPGKGKSHCLPEQYEAACLCMVVLYLGLSGMVPRTVLQWILFKGPLVSGIQGQQIHHNARSINYGVPGYVFGFTDYKKQAVKTTDPVFKRPTRTATFLESMPEGRYHEIGISGANWNGDGIGYQYEYPNYNAKTLGINYYVREYRHGQKKYLNAAFLDGHVDKRSYKSFIRRCTVMPVLDWALTGERVLCHPNGNCPE